MNLSQARVVDPVLTNHARGYKHNDRVGGLLFPRVEVSVGAGQVIEFGKESFHLYAARRAPGANTKQIQFGYFGRPFQLYQDSLESVVPREMMRDAKAVPGIDLGMRAVSTVMGAVSLLLENEQATIATTAENYDSDHKVTLSSTTKWTHADSDPMLNIEVAKEAIRQSTGLSPNVMVLAPAAYRALRNHAKIIDKIKYSQVGVVTTDLLAQLFELEKVSVGRAVYSDSDTGTFVNIWGNAAVVAYAPQNPAGAEEPSYGYTYTMEGHPMVEPPYWDGNRKSWIYGGTLERAPVLCGMSAGYLIITPA